MLWAFSRKRLPRANLDRPVKKILSRRCHDSRRATIPLWETGREGKELHVQSPSWGWARLREGSMLGPLGSMSLNAFKAELPIWSPDVPYIPKYIASSVHMLFFSLFSTLFICFLYSGFSCGFQNPQLIRKYSYGVTFSTFKYTWCTNILK